jgi:hypothetical protein
MPSRRIVLVGHPTVRVTAEDLVATGVSWQAPVPGLNARDFTTLVLDLERARDVDPRTWHFWQEALKELVGGSWPGTF